MIDLQKSVLSEIVCFLFITLFLELVLIFIDLQTMTFSEYSITRTTSRGQHYYNLELPSSYICNCYIFVSSKLYSMASKILGITGFSNYLAFFKQLC